jgi:GDP-L-fucose synthase
MAGSAIMRALHDRGYHRLVTAPHRELDLTRQSSVENFMFHHRPDVVVIAAAKSSDASHSHQADVIYKNLLIAANIIHAAHLVGTERLLFLGSFRVYPKFAAQPVTENSLLTGSLEPTNEADALAKIAGLKLCEHYRAQHGRLFHAAVPCHLYGPGDNYRPESSRLIPALIRQFHEARQARLPETVVRGTGTPLREFLHVDDFASACLHLLGLDNPPSVVNVGSGSEISVGELAGMVADAVRYEGKIAFDGQKPEGTPEKALDSSLMSSMGWAPRIDLPSGLTSVYSDFLQLEAALNCAA